MFFPRLRKQVKWMFVFLALSFAVGFVVFNVGGAGPSGGIGDLFRNAGGSSGPSASDARDRIEKNPKDAQAYRDLSTALQTEGKLDEAIPPLRTFVRLRPKDVDAPRELASLYLRQAEVATREAQQAQLESAETLPGLSFPLPGKFGTAVGQDAITSSVSSLVNDRMTKALTKRQQAYQKAVGVYKKLAAVVANDPDVQLELAQTADAAQDTKTAIAAYKRFLKLAPDASTAPDIRRRIKQLQQPTSISQSAG